MTILIDPTSATPLYEQIVQQIQRQILSGTLPQGELLPGHDVQVALNNVAFGRGQMILKLENGTLVGGTEGRTDSNIACW